MIIADALPPTPAPIASNCAAPNVPPHVVALVRPTSAQKYLETYHKSGIVDVKVFLARTGAVMRAVIVRSSGDAFLDGATYDAAVATTYQAEVRDCEAVEGAYIYRTKYNAQPIPEATATPAPAPALTPAPAPAPTPPPAPVFTTMPTTVPTTVATTVATTVPTTVPTTLVTTVPTLMPTTIPTTVATTVPTTVPTIVPTSAPATSPTAVPVHV